jgi:hypothetical protein
LKEKIEAEEAAKALEQVKHKKQEFDPLEDFDKRFGGVIEPSGRVIARKKTLSKHGKMSFRNNLKPMQKKTKA